MAQAIKTYTLWTYDVWGNAEEGYDVNDRSCLDREFAIPTTHEVFNVGTPQEFATDEPTDAQIIKALKDAGYLKKSVQSRRLTIDGEPESMTVDYCDGFPLFGLELNQD